MNQGQTNMLLFGVVLLALAFLVIPALSIFGISLTSFFITNQFNGALVFQAILGGLGIVFVVIPFGMKRGAS